MAQEPQQAAPKPDAAAAQKAAAEDREARQAASIGAQVILDFNDDAAVGARGGAAGTIEENSAVRDAALLKLGLDPVAPSGPPSEDKAKRMKEAAAATPPPPKVPAKATRASSLAVGA